MRIYNSPHILPLYCPCPLYYPHSPGPCPLSLIPLVPCLLFPLSLVSYSPCPLSCCDRSVAYVAETHLVMHDLTVALRGFQEALALQTHGLGNGIHISSDTHTDTHTNTSSSTSSDPHPLTHPDTPYDTHLQPISDPHPLTHPDNPLTPPLTFLWIKHAHTHLHGVGCVHRDVGDSLHGIGKVLFHQVVNNNKDNEIGRTPTPFNTPLTSLLSP